MIIPFVEPFSITFAPIIGSPFLLTTVPNILFFPLCCKDSIRLSPFYYWKGEHNAHQSHIGYSIRQIYFSMLPVNRVLKKYRYITVNIDIFVIDKQIVSLFLNLIQDILKSNIIFVNRYTDIL